MVLLAPWEEYFLDEIKDLPMEKSLLPYLNPDENNKVCKQLFSLPYYFVLFLISSSITLLH